MYSDREMCWVKKVCLPKWLIFGCDFRDVAHTPPSNINKSPKWKNQAGKIQNFLYLTFI